MEVRVGVRIRGFAGEGEDHDLQAKAFVEVPLRAIVRYKSGELGATRVPCASLSFLLNMARPRSSGRRSRR